MKFFKKTRKRLKRVKKRGTKQVRRANPLISSGERKRVKYLKTLISRDRAAENIKLGNSLKGSIEKFLHLEKKKSKSRRKKSRSRSRSRSRSKSRSKSRSRSRSKSRSKSRSR